VDSLNLRTGMVNEKWDLILFVDNLTDERANLRTAAQSWRKPRGQRLVVNRPRTLA
jgi:hypothetical protein